MAGAQGKKKAAIRPLFPFLLNIPVINLIGFQDETVTNR